MKFYVIGFIFNATKDKVLLVRKNKPEWQVGRWNGMGGKIGDHVGCISETPLEAMRRECKEETGLVDCDWEHCLTFVCPGGTVFVYRDITPTEEIMFEQLETEQLEVWRLDSLPEKLMSNLKWIIPVCLSTIQFPLIVQQNTLGCDE